MYVRYVNYPSILSYRGSVNPHAHISDTLSLYLYHKESDCRACIAVILRIHSIQFSRHVPHATSTGQPLLPLFVGIQYYSVPHVFKPTLISLNNRPFYPPFYLFSAVSLFGVRVQGC